MNTEPAATAPAPQSAPPPKRTKLTQTLPTDRITFPKQPEILRAFVAASEKSGGPVSNDEVGRFVNLSGSTVSQINAFFTDVGLLQRAEAGKFTPTAPAIEYFKLHQFSADRAWSKLAPVFERSWFGTELLSKLKFRPLDESEAITDLALASNAEKGYEPQLKIAIDWLVQVGLATREGSQIKQVLPSTPGHQDNNGSAPKSPAAPIREEEKEPDGEDLQKSILPLDKSLKRRLIVWAPPTITKKELERIKAWLAVQLIVSDEDEPAK